MRKKSQLIPFHSWRTAYKNPFGAISYGESVKLNFLGSFYRQVTLVIHKDFGSSYEIEMNKEDERFTTDFKPQDDAGLYFYHFRVLTQEGDTIFYGNNSEAIGGKGAWIYELEDIREYQLTVYKKSDPAPNWYRKGVAYHIFVERFNNGNEEGKIMNPKKNSFLYASPEDLPYYIKNKNGDIVRWEFYGGNLLGIIKKLSYLDKLGISILYLSPIFEARSNHKYDTGDYFQVDPMFGTEEDFKRLVTEAGKRNIHIILDGVFNHTGADSRYFNAFGSYEEVGAYQSKDSAYANWYTFNNFPDSYNSWWGIKDLPALNTEVEEVKSFIYKSPDSVVRYWTRMGIGGWRLDVADELSDTFLFGMRQALEEEALFPPVLIGEVWEDASNKIAYGKRRHYIEGDVLHGTMNYPFRSLIIHYLNQKQTPYEVAKQFTHFAENYPKDILLNNLNNIGSHDTARIATSLGMQKEKIELAFVLLFTLPGVPCIYYGDEVGLEGAQDPDNRRMYPWGKEDKNLLAHVKKLTSLRNSLESLQKGTFYPFSMANIFGFVRYISDGEWAIMLFNETNEIKKITLPSTLFKILEIKDQLIDFEVEAFCLKAYSSLVITENETIEL
ncbi:glycoside hydrolase family 13 protein [Lacticigenium naphthae]|uniref:glycoside hydrolase family 13 protein n=1 Tax=Lacticigenium naphthae TaxID=515351 RepID=UPI0003FE12BF|nr:glycoside hydrolase family 13 protein [Lacticigenium naphthae]